MARPPSKTFDHLLLWMRVTQQLKSGRLSKRQACERVRKEYYPDKSSNGFWQTWLELSKIKLKPNARPESDGYIHGDQYKPRTGARNRMLTLYNLYAMILAGRCPPGMDELTYQNLREILKAD